MEKVFALIEDLRAWNAWSPWEKLDPTMKKTYGGPTSGRGPAQFFWKVMRLFMNMDQMIGKDFEAGLADMKAAAERR